VVRAGWRTNEVVGVGSQQVERSVRVVRWLTAAQAVWWTLAGSGLLVLYGVGAARLRGTEGEEQFAGAVQLLMLAPFCLLGLVPMVLWWWAFGALRERRDSAVQRIQLAGAVTAALPMMLVGVPDWLLPYRGFVLAALGLLAVPALVSVFTARSRQLVAHLIVWDRVGRTPRVVWGRPPRR
jgi:hypothetical protein